MVANIVFIWLGSGLIFITSCFGSASELCRIYEVRLSVVELPRDITRFQFSPEVTEKRAYGESLKEFFIHSWRQAAILSIFTQALLFDFFLSDQSTWNPQKLVQAVVWWNMEW